MRLPSPLARTDSRSMAGQESTYEETKLPKATAGDSQTAPSKPLLGAWGASVTHRDTDFPQDLLGNSFGFFQHLIQRPAILK